ncbi:MAG: glycosyltransferase family 1 protein [Pseudomonadota bacterium]|nr:glycosyltransferase family 1 protein [Pseudomonadota bacterium]
MPRHVPHDGGGLRITLVTETWPPEINGVAHSVFQLAQGLRLQGHHLCLIRPTQQRHTAQSPAHEELLVRGFAIPRYPELQFGAPAYARIKAKLAEYQPDIVHVVTEGPLGLAAVYAARALNIPVSSGFHSPFHEFSRFFGLGIFLTPIMSYLRFFHNRTDVTCVPSEKTRAQLAHVGIRDLVVVGRGVNTKQFHPSHRSDALREQWGVSASSTVMLYVGRLSPEKNIDLVVAAFRELRLNQPMREIKLVLVGDGPDRSRLEKLAPDAIFAGMQTGADLGQHYASADVFVFASQVETFGNVVLEAMASGLPVLAFDDACAGQVVQPEQSGWLCALQQDQIFVHMAGRLPKQNRLKEMGEQAQQDVQRMSWHHPVLQLEQAFDLAKQNQQQRRPNKELTQKTQQQSSVKETLS